MSTIVTRSGKGSPLSHVEVDANFSNLNTDKIQSGNTVAALTITSASITDIAVTGTVSFDGAQGTAGQALTSAGTGATPTWTTIAASPGGSTTQIQYNSSGSFAGSSNLTFDGTNLSFNSGYGSAAVAYGCRAWVNFNGTGTPAIRASANVSSITDGGTGIYEINFTTAMPDANYASIGMTGDNRIIGSGLIGVNTASACKISVQSAGALSDETYIFVAIFR